MVIKSSHTLEKTQPNRSQVLLCSNSSRRPSPPISSGKKFRPKSKNQPSGNYPSELHKELTTKNNHLELIRQRTIRNRHNRNRYSKTIASQIHNQIHSRRTLTTHTNNRDPITIPTTIPGTNPSKKRPSHTTTTTEEINTASTTTTNEQQSTRLQPTASEPLAGVQQKLAICLHLPQPIPKGSERCPEI